MSFVLSERSLKNYKTLHKDLKAVIDYALKISEIDFAIVEGHRSVERQKLLFRKGKTRIDGINRLGKHNYDPSMAFDFCVIAKDVHIYDRDHLLYLIGIFKAIGGLLYEQGFISHRIRSGANWDMDGVLLRDQSFDDMPHIELIK